MNPVSIQTLRLLVIVINCNKIRLVWKLNSKAYEL